MHPLTEHALKSTWLILGLYWLWSARKVKHVKATEAMAKRFIAYALPWIVAGAMLGPGEWYGRSFLHDPFLPETTLLEWIGLGLVLLGIAIACWSRHLLGQNWSVSVQLKHDHQLLQSGPYAIVRHPIYAGLLLALLGTTVLIGEWRALIAFVIVFASLLYKYRVEEKWLKTQFDPAYSQYMTRTKAMIPGIL